MERIIGFFWNESEDRLRALWRLLIQVILLVSVNLFFSIIVGLFFGLTGREIDTTALIVPVMCFEFPFLIFSIWVLCKFVDNRKFSDLGFSFNRNWWTDMVFGLFLGFSLISAVFFIERSLGWVEITGFCKTLDPDASFLLTILPLIFLFIVIGFREEIVFRGYQFMNLAEGINVDSIGPKLAIIFTVAVTSIKFGIIHAVNPDASLISTCSCALAGVALALPLVYTGELALSIGFHITWNLAQFLYGFPISGMKMTSVRMVEIEQTGPEWITGGGFGPEAGILGIAGFTLGALILMIWIRFRYGPLKPHWNMAEPPIQKSITQKLPKIDLE